MEPDLVIIDAASADFELLELGSIGIELIDELATLAFELMFPATIEMELTS